MRDQYAGDISDLLKFSLLLHLTGNERSIGVAWYYNKNDGRRDGRHRDHMDEEKWRVLDPVHSALRTMKEHSVSALQQLSFWPDSTVFHYDAGGVPKDGKDRMTRWKADMIRDLATAQLVLVDPDNGIGTSQRHATTEEVKQFIDDDKIVLLIKFPGFLNHELQLADYHDRLHNGTGCKKLVTLKTSVSVAYQENSNRTIPRTRWFTVINPDDGIIAKIASYCRILEQINRVKASVCAANY